MMDPKELMAEAAVLEPQLQNWRRTLHRHPEVGFDLPKTGGYGTWMFTIGGVALLGAAAFIVIRSRKHKNEQ